MSPLLRAAADARRGLSRMPSAAATTTTMHGRRTMASSARTETMEGAWLFRLGLCWVAGVLIGRAVETKMRSIAEQAHEEEINAIRREVKALQASNHELRAVLRKHLPTTKE